MELLAKRYSMLDGELEEKKRALGAKLTPLFEQFLDETGLPIRSVLIDYLEITSMNDDVRKYMVAGARFRMEDIENTIVIKGMK